MGVGYLFLALALMLNATANVLLKNGAAEVGSLGEPNLVGRLVTNYHLLAGLSLFALNVVFYVLALTRLNLSVAYPIMMAGGVGIIAAVSVLLLQEALTMRQGVGLFLLMWASCSWRSGRARERRVLPDHRGRWLPRHQSRAFSARAGAHGPLPGHRPLRLPGAGCGRGRSGDIRDRPTVERAMAGINLVVHCAAALPLYTRKEIFWTDVEGTRLLLESALVHGVSRFIHISSTAVYGIPDHHPIHEDDRLEGVGPYNQAKIQAEQVCLAFPGQEHVRPHPSPKSLVGPERLGVFELLYDWACNGRNFPVLGSGDNRYQLLDVEDLCRAITSARRPIGTLSMTRSMSEQRRSAPCAKTFRRCWIVPAGGAGSSACRHGR